MPETDAREKSGTRAGVLLRADRFDLITAVLGASTELKRSALLKVDPKTIYLARRGVVGEKFIASVLSALERHADQLARLNITTAFEEVFEVGDKRTAV